MATYFVNDDGGGAADGSTWADAYTSMQALITARTALSSGDIVYIGADSNDSGTHAGDFTIVGPTSGGPAYLISSTVGAGTTVSYAQGTGTQIDTSTGSGNVIFDGSFSAFGLKIKSADDIRWSGDNNETIWTEDCIFLPAAGSQVELNSSGNAPQATHIRPTFDCSQTTSGSTSVIAVFRNQVDIFGGSLVNATNRTGAFINAGTSGTARISGFDMSDASVQSSLEFSLGATEYGKFILNNMKMPSGWANSRWTQASISAGGGYIFAVNCGDADHPEGLYFEDSAGSIESDTTVLRASGGSAESVDHSWKLTTIAATETQPLYTPWMYGVISSAGTKSFTCYCANNNEDYSDNEVWLEVEVLGTANVATYTLYSDRRGGSGSGNANILSNTTAYDNLTSTTDQADDTADAWSGTTLTYQQTLSVGSVAVGEEGQFRARVGFACTTASRVLYVDPKVTVA